MAGTAGSSRSGPGQQPEGESAGQPAGEAAGQRQEEQRRAGVDALGCTAARWRLATTSCTEQQTAARRAVAEPSAEPSSVAAEHRLWWKGIGGKAADGRNDYL